MLTKNIYKVIIVILLLLKGSTQKCSHALFLFAGTFSHGGLVNYKPYSKSVA